MATETHKIMSRVRSTFEERYGSRTLPMCRGAEESLTLRDAFYRTTKSVESIVVRREVAKMFPSPGPGRYTGGISIDKLGKHSVLLYFCRALHERLRGPAEFLLSFHHGVALSTVSTNVPLSCWQCKPCRWARRTRSPAAAP
jgi:hypothetical protein